MAKKSTAKKPASSPKAAAKGGKKKAPAKKVTEPAELALDATEEKALDLVGSSKSVCKELELTVTSAVADSVRKVFKKHQISLSPLQANNVALVLFGD